MLGQGSPTDHWGRLLLSIRVWGSGRVWLDCAGSACAQPAPKRCPAGSITGTGMSLLRFVDIQPTQGTAQQGAPGEVPQYLVIWEGQTSFPSTLAPGKALAAPTKPDPTVALDVRAPLPQLELATSWAPEKQCL